MSRETLLKNIRIAEAKLGQAGTDWERQILRNCITTYKGKLKAMDKKKRAELNKNRS